MRPLFLLLTTLVLSHHALAGIQKDLNGKEGIQIQQQSYSLKVVQLLQQSASRDQQNINLQQTADLIIENHLIAGEALRQFGEDALLSTENRIGFPDEYLLEIQYTATLEYLFKSAIQAQTPKLDIGNYITQPFQCKNKMLIKSLALGKRQEFQLPDGELAIANQYSLIKFQFPQTPASNITLGDIYRQQNVQGRIALHNGDCNFLQAATQQYLGQLYLQNWVQQNSGLNSNEIEQLKTALRMRYIKDRYLAMLGIAQHAHDDSPYENALAKKITQQEIANYYQQHQDQFKRVTKARGRHIMVKNQALADKIYNELVAGLDFNKAIKKYTQAEDKNSATPGAVGWVYNSASTGWRDSLFLILPQAQINRPFKAPSGHEWEIIIVDSRIEEFQGAESEGVRYQVSHILARKKIAQEFAIMKKRLRTETSVSVNPVLMRLADNI